MEVNRKSMCHFAVTSTLLSTPQFKLPTVVSLQGFSEPFVSSPHLLYGEERQMCMQRRAPG